MRPRNIEKMVEPNANLQIVSRDSPRIYRGKNGRTHLVTPVKEKHQKIYKYTKYILVSQYCCTTKKNGEFEFKEDGPSHPLTYLLVAGIIHRGSVEYQQTDFSVFWSGKRGLSDRRMPHRTTVYCILRNCCTWYYIARINAGVTT